MRASNDLKKLLAACSVLFATLVVAEDANLSTEQSLSDATVLFDDQQMSAELQQSGSLDDYLSELKRKQFDYEYEKADQETNKLRDSWIRPVMLRYSFSRANKFSETENQNAAIAIDQPIFQSGGIVFGVKYASASRDFANYSIDQQKRLMIKQAVSLLMQVKQSELTLKKQQLQVANSQINLEQKREQYLNGQLDSGFLNNAIIELNLVKQANIDLETRDAQLIAQFKKLSDLDPKTAPIPFLAIIDETQFLEENIDMKLAESESEKNRLFKNVTLVKYLPEIRLQASYNWEKNSNSVFNPSFPESKGYDVDYYRYGVAASMPLDINSYNDFQAAKVDYLKAKIVIDDKKRELKLLFDQVMQNMINYDKKITLSQENREVYDVLLGDTTDLFRAGYKTQYDVDLLTNSMEIEEINQKVYAIDKQLELLNLYEKMSSDVQ